LALALLLGGRLVRQQMLVGPDGKWREHLWLEALIETTTAPAAAAKPPRPVLTTPLPINTCSADSLTLLPGVGAVLAARIAEARAAGLVFCNAEDLRRVKGIGPALSARLDSLVMYAEVPRPDSTAASSP
jgi:predicted flap endonuclease-1-like 5' DNA nuclease